MNRFKVGDVVVEECGGDEFAVGVIIEVLSESSLNSRNRYHVFLLCHYSPHYHPGWVINYLEEHLRPLTIIRKSSFGEQYGLLW